VLYILHVKIYFAKENNEYNAGEKQVYLAAASILSSPTCP